MPEFEVILKYTVTWIGSKTIKAKNEEVAQERIEAQFSKVVDLLTFEKFAEGVTIDSEELEVEEVQEL